MQHVLSSTAENRRQFGIGTKITTGYVIILAALVIIAIVLLANLNTLLGEFSQVVEHDFQIIEHAKELEQLVISMETGERGYLLTGNESFLEPYNDAQANFDSVAEALAELISENEQQSARLQELIELKDDWLNNAVKPLIEQRKTIGNISIAENNIVAFNNLFSTVASGVGKERMDNIRVKFDEFLTVEMELNQQRVTEASNTVNSLQMMVIGITAVGLVIGLGTGTYLGRSISGNVRKVMEAAQGVANGDLKLRVRVNSNDEVARLGEAFNSMADSLEKTMASQVAKDYIEGVINQYRAFVAQVTEGDLTGRLELQQRTANASDDDLYQLGLNLNAMVERLSDMAQQVREAASGVSSAAAEILAATTQQIASATEQDAAVTQTMTTVEEVRATVKQTAERAQTVAETSRQSVEISQGGQEAVSDTVNGMKLVRQRVESIAENILMLSERTQQIGEIIDTVNEIASQSKLLALNASIEAARAGEEGKGFAVVAMEVRQLAEQSREATARVRDILNQIQQATNTAVMVTEEGSKGAESGVQLVERAGDSIRDLSQTIENASQAAIQIAASTHQQMNGMDQLAAAMSSIKQATTQTAASTRQAERSAQDLNQMSQQMQRAVARYRLKGMGGSMDDVEYGMSNGNGSGNGHHYGNGVKVYNGKAS